MENYTSLKHWGSSGVSSFIGSSSFRYTTSVSHFCEMLIHLQQSHLVTLEQHVRNSHQVNSSPAPARRQRHVDCGSKGRWLSDL